MVLMICNRVFPFGLLLYVNVHIPWDYYETANKYSSKIFSLTFRTEAVLQNEEGPRFRLKKEPCPKRKRENFATIIIGSLKIILTYIRIILYYLRLPISFCM